MLQTFNHQGKSIEILRGGREWYLEMQSGVGVERERRYLKGVERGVGYLEFYLISTSRRTLQLHSMKEVGSVSVCQQCSVTVLQSWDHTLV